MPPLGHGGQGRRSRGGWIGWSIFLKFDGHLLKVITFGPSVNLNLDLQWWDFEYRWATLGSSCPSKSWNGWIWSNLSKGSNSFLEFGEFLTEIVIFTVFLRDYWFIFYGVSNKIFLASSFSSVPELTWKSLSKRRTVLIWPFFGFTPKMKLSWRMTHCFFQWEPILKVYDS